MTTKPSFTLIELLIVISIIGILLGIISVSFTTAQKQARDSRRRQDLVKIQNALEQYYTLNSTYPTNNNEFTSAFQGSQTPTDPKNTGNYIYYYNYNSTGYCICAKLEQSGHGNANAPTSTTCNWNSQGDYLCVQNQQ